MIAVYRREIRALLTSPMGVVLIAGFVVAMVLLGLFVMPRQGGGDWFAAKDLTMNTFFAAFPWVAAVILPAVSMRAWSEDIRGGTYQLLVTMPMPIRSVVIAKFLSFLTFLILMLAATLLFPAMVISQASGTVAGAELGPIFGGYLGCFLLGSAFLALGMFISGLTSSQMIAFIGTMVACGGLVAWSNFAGLAAADGGDWWTRTLRFLSVEIHFAEVAQGKLPLDGMVLFASIMMLFLVLNTWWLEGRRYQ